MTTSRVRLATAALAVVVLTLSGCGGSQRSGESAAVMSGPAVAGGPCAPADASAQIDGVPHRCMLRSEKTLVWTPEGGRGGQDGGNGQAAFGLTSSAAIPAVVQNWGFDLQPYDPATGRAGVMQIKGARTPAPDPHNLIDPRYLFLDYGDPESGRTDLQMTFLLPLGTPVLAMTDGVVCDVPTLYSGDYSVRIAPTGVDCVATGRAAVLFETEHVIDPLVKVGDTVVAGTRVATVGDYRKDWAALGFGVVEIGAFFSKAGDSSPWHACPARFLHPARADGMRAALASIQAAWEAESGYPDLYDAAAESPLGCTTTADFNN